MITNITDWGLSLKASSESKDFFMHNIIATIKAALGCHDTDLLDIFMNVSMQYLIETEAGYVRRGAWRRG